VDPDAIEWTAAQGERCTAIIDSEAQNGEHPQVLVDGSPAGNLWMLEITADTESLIA
jgi:hypothetical protein